MLLLRVRIVAFPSAVFIGNLNGMFSVSPQARGVPETKTHLHGICTFFFVEAYIGTGDHLIEMIYD